MHMHMPLSTEHEKGEIEEQNYPEAQTHTTPYVQWVMSVCWPLH